MSYQSDVRFCSLKKTYVILTTKNDTKGLSDFCFRDNQKEPLELKYFIYTNNAYGCLVFLSTVKLEIKDYLTSNHFSNIRGYQYSKDSKECLV